MDRHYKRLEMPSAAQGTCILGGDWNVNIDNGKRQDLLLDLTGVWKLCGEH